MSTDRKKTNAGAKSKPGRPSIYSDDLADRICAALAEGRSARSVCAADDMPSMQTFWRWLRENPSFRERYAHAKSESADAMVEDMLDIADDGTNDFTEDDEGKVRFNAEHVQRSRLRVDVRKWVASKLKPKRYGDALDLNHGTQPGDPLAEIIKGCMNTSLSLNPKNTTPRD